MSNQPISTSAMPVTASSVAFPAPTPLRRITRPPPVYNPYSRGFVTRSRVLSAPSFRRNATSALEEGATSSVSSAASSRCASEEPQPQSDANHAGLPLHHSRRAADLPNADQLREELRRLNSFSGFQFDPSEIFLMEQSNNPDKTEETDLPSLEEGKVFLIALARALMKYGSPTHRIEAQLTASAFILGIDLEVIHIPKFTLLSFRRRDGTRLGGLTRLVKSSDSVELGRLRELHTIYKDVIHRRQSVADATKQLKALTKKKPIYGIPMQILLAGCFGMIISPMAFKGSVLDSLAAGLLCAAITAFRTIPVQNKFFGKFMDIGAAMLIAFVARGLSSLPSGIFCYSAIAYSALVKLFPKYLVICGSLELASKQILTGSVKIVYALIWCLFLGLTTTMGSDFYFLVDPSARQRRLFSTDYMAHTMTIYGTFIADGSSQISTFTFTNDTLSANNRLYTAHGCYRDPNWPWYLRAPPEWTLLFLVPLFSIFSALASFQPIGWGLLVNIVVSSCAYAANRVVHTSISYRNDACSAMGALVIGTLGHLYSRLFHGTAFISMFNGIGFLVPSAIVATGGFSQNYRGKSSDHFTASINLSTQMLQVALGTTVGLVTSTWIVYSFGSKKKGALWAF